jgi:uncharacterized protein DUF3237
MFLGWWPMIDSRHLYDLWATAALPVRTALPLGSRGTSIIREGMVTGDRIRGRVLPGGGDWMLTDSLGVGHIDARYMIETEDGLIVQAFYGGRLVFLGDSLQRLREGKPAEEQDLYFRVAVTFNAPEEYGWLNQLQAVGIGSIEPVEQGNIVRYRVFEVL